jgi:hypothetical protein
LLFGRQAEAAEAAITLPVAILVTLAFVNMSLAGFSSVNAAIAAYVGARYGSVAQEGASAAATRAAYAQINAAPVGEYNVSVSGGGRPGSVIAVTVHWEFPNYFKGLAGFFGLSLGDFEGTAVSTLRQEGW